MAPSISTILLSAALALTQWTTASPVSTDTQDRHVTILPDGSATVTNHTLGHELASGRDDTTFQVFYDTNCNQYHSTIVITKQKNNPYGAQAGPLNPYFTWKGIKWISGPTRDLILACYQGDSSSDVAIEMYQQVGPCQSDNGKDFDKFYLEG